MNIDWNNLPLRVQPFKNQVMASKCNSIELQLSPSEKLTLWQSKVGGKPYLPIDTRYPRNIEGQFLKLIAQINFAELPTNELYPTHGILQFYINTQDDLLGLDFDNQQTQNDFKVMYFKDISEKETELQHDFPIQDSAEDTYPISGQYAIQFTLGESYIGVNDVNFSKQVVDIDEADYVEDEIEDFLDDYDEVFSTQGHRLGGYPAFTQTDPRERIERLKEYVLLLQIDSDDGIMWGDSGVANFFIHPDDLKKRDFSKVMYNWDCS